MTASAFSTSLFFFFVHRPPRTENTIMPTPILVLLLLLTPSLILAGLIGAREVGAALAASRTRRRRAQHDKIVRLTLRATAISEHWYAWQREGSPFSRKELDLQHALMQAISSASMHVLGQVCTELSLPPPLVHDICLHRHALRRMREMYEDRYGDMDNSRAY